MVGTEESEQPVSGTGVKLAPYAEYSRVEAVSSAEEESPLAQESNRKKNNGIDRIRRFKKGPSSYSKILEH